MNITNSQIDICSVGGDTHFALNVSVKCASFAEAHRLVGRMAAFIGDLPTASPSEPVADPNAATESADSAPTPPPEKTRRTRGKSAADSEPATPTPAPTLTPAATPVVEPPVAETPKEDWVSEPKSNVLPIRPTTAPTVETPVVPAVAEAAPAVAAPSADGVPAEIMSADKPRDVVLHLNRAAIATTQKAVSDWCASHQETVPILARTPNMLAKVTKLAELLGMPAA